MEQKLKDENWIDIMKKHGDIRLFSSLCLKKARKGAAASAQEVDMLFRVALAKEPVTPHELSCAMGVSKTIVSRLIEHLTEKKLIEKQYSESDHRSYFLTVTEKGKMELDSLYNYYLEPIYILKDRMGEEAFSRLTELIDTANRILEEAAE